MGLAVAAAAVYSERSLATDVGGRSYPAVVVAGAMREWANNAIECALVDPRPGRPAGLYECGHTTGMGMRSYATVLVAWAVCGRVNDNTERSSVKARPGRPSGGGRSRKGLTTTAGSDVGRRSAETRCGMVSLYVGRRSTEARCGWLGPNSRAL